MKSLTLTALALALLAGPAVAQQSATPRDAQVAAMPNPGALSAARAETESLARRVNRLLDPVAQAEAEAQLRRARAALDGGDARTAQAAKERAWTVIQQAEAVPESPGA